MNTSLRLFISLLFGITAALLFPIDPDGDDYTHVFLASTYIMTMGFFIPFSLYTSQSKEVRTNEDGQDIPTYLESSKKREMFGVWSILTTSGIILILLFTQSSAFSKETLKLIDAYILGPAVWYLFIAIYFFITKECPYCKALNGPMKHSCKECNNVLPDHAVNTIIDKQT